MDILGTKIKGEFVSSPGMGALANQWWGAIKDGTPLIKSMEVVRKGKSNKQLGAIFGLMLKHAAVELAYRGEDTSLIFNLTNPTGIEICVNDLKQYFYTTCPIYNEEGIRITLSKSNTLEAAKFFNDVQAWLAGQWAIVVPDPDKNWQEKLTTL